jgi:CHAT domain-containing protein/Tfp pilus assembly protein PilF
MKTFLFGFLLPLFLLTAYAVGESAQGREGDTGDKGSSSRASGDSTREPAGEGEASGNLSALEAKAQEAERNNKWEEAAVLYNQASAAASRSGRYEQAISYGNKAFETGEKGKAPTRQVRAILNLSYAYRFVGQPAKAGELLQKGKEIVKQIPSSLTKDFFQAAIYTELGLGFLRNGETQKAIENISYSFQVLDSLLSSMMRAPTRYREAIKTTKTTMVTTLQRLGWAYKDAGKPDEAIKAFERALGIIKDSALVSPWEGRIYQQLGAIYLEQKDFARALENLTKATEVGYERKTANLTQNANSQIGDVLRLTNKSSEAIPYYKKAIDTIETTRSLLESEEFRSSFFDDKRKTYSGIILAYLGEKNWDEAFNYSERARSRAFLDILGSKAQLSHGGLLEEERALQARMSALRAKMPVAQEGEAGGPGQAQLQREVDEAQRAYNDFLAKVRKENKEQASLMNVEPLTLKQLQELLEPGVTVLEYFVTVQQVLLWIVEKDRLQFVTVPIGRKELVSKVSALRESVLQLGEKEKFRVSSQELYKLLIEPALPHIRGKELLIIPHDVLHYLPFQALMSAQGKYLVQDYPIHYLSSASLMQFTREKKRAGGEQALVMGNPSLGDEAYNLRFAEREAKEVANVYPKSAVYLRAEASKSRAISLSPKYDMLHFAVHAELNEEDPMSSALLLAPEGSGDGRLKVGEIFSLNLKAGMVVLSACETGLGKLSNGDDLVGLTRAFIYAGTPSIVTTLWKVNDRASYELMREFYQHLKGGKKSDALRQAQLKTMKEFPEPFYWAAYQLTGEP